MHVRAHKKKETEREIAMHKTHSTDYPNSTA